MRISLANLSLFRHHLAAMELLIVGTGYVGLVTGACFAEMGYQVTCLDVNYEKITALQNGYIPIYEPGLEEIVRRNSKAGRLHFTTDYKAAVERATICLIAVDTPVGENGAADLRSLTAACHSIGEHLNGYKVICTKSTVPVGTAAFVKKTIRAALDRREASHDFDVVSNPEFLKEGSSVQDFMKPDRVIIGVETKRAEELMRSLYKPFMLSQERLYVMDIQSAEITKYAANAMLATRISFMNSLSKLCEATGADITQVRRGIGSDERIGLHFLWAGCGFGGSCFPKDLRALDAMMRSHELNSSLFEAVININEQQKETLFQKIANYFEDRGSLKDKTIGILGLSFKPDTDDMREAPALTLIQSLVEAGCHVRLYDPVAMPNAKKLIPQSSLITWCESESEVATNANALVLVTEWKQFRLLDYKALLSTMKGHAFFDGRNQYKPQEMAAIGFDYFSIGRPALYASLENEWSAQQPSIVQSA